MDELGRSPFCRHMTVAQIRGGGEEQQVEVMFLESARFYRLTRANPAFREALGLLQRALTEGKTLKVCCSSLDSDLIEHVES